MNIRAVLIDIDNTILDFNKSAIAAINQCAKKHGINLPDNYARIFFEVNDKLWGLLEQSVIVKQDIYDRRWNMIFSELQIDADGHAFEEDFRKEMRTTAITVDGADEILSYLSEKYPVYTASNASRLQQEARLEKTGLSKYLSGMFTSEEIGFQKPAKEFFHACYEALYPIKPEEIIMIGDSVNADIIGAKNFGFRSLWFNFRNEEYTDYNFTDFKVDHLREIKDIL